MKILNKSKDFKNKNYKKNIYLSNFYNYYIKELLNTGLYFYKLTYKLDETLKDFNYILHTISNNYKNIEDIIKTRINNLMYTIQDIELIDFSFNMISKDQNNNFYIHSIIGIRAFHNVIENLNLHILKVLHLNFFNFKEDISIEYLDTFLKIKCNFIKISKNCIKTIQFKKQYFFTFSKINETIHKQFINFFNDEDYYKNLEYSHINGKYASIQGFNFYKNVTKYNLPLYYLNMYLKLNKMVFCHRLLYKASEESEYKYNYVGNSNYLLNNLNEVLLDLKKRFKIFESFYFLKKLLKNVKELKKVLKKNSSLLLNKQINFNILEFVDGLYFLETDYFLTKKDLSNPDFMKIKLNLSCFRQYQVKYKKLNLKNYKEKSLWLKTLYKTLKNEEEVKDCCIRFGEYFSLLDESFLTKKEVIQSDKVTSLDIKIKEQKEKKVDLLNEYLFKKEHKIFYEIFMLLLHDDFILPSKKTKKKIKDLTEKDIDQDLKESDLTSLFFGKIPKKESDKECLLKKRLHLYNKLVEVNLLEKDLEFLKKEELSFILYCTKLFIKTKKQRLTKKEQKEFLNCFKIN
jgi:hypothetical protein